MITKKITITFHSNKSTSELNKLLTEIAIKYLDPLCDDNTKWNITAKSK